MGEAAEKALVMEENEKMSVGKYIKNVLIGIDQLANAVIGGDPDETISSRAGKEVRKGRRGGWRILCLILNHFDKDHCQESIEEDEGGDAVVRQE